MRLPTVPQARMESAAVVRRVGEPFDAVGAEGAARSRVDGDRRDPQDRQVEGMASIESKVEGGDQAEPLVPRCARRAAARSSR